MKDELKGIIEEIKLVKKEILKNDEYIKGQILQQENLKGYLEGLEFALQKIDEDFKF